MRRNGFTLVELLVTLAILVVVSTAGFISLSGYRGSQILKSSMNQVVAVIRDVQNRAITQQDGKPWGVHFSNPSGGGDNYQLFSGSGYTTSSVTQTYYLSNNIQFGEPAIGFNVDEVFAALSGNLPADKIISLVTGRKDGLVGDIILRPQGTITTRQENGLIGYWHLDEGVATTTYDAAGFGNSGLLYSSSTICANPPTAGCPTWQSASNCKGGACLSFDGVDDYAQLSNLSVNTVNGAKTTVEFWMYWNGIGNRMPFGFTNYALYFWGTGQFGFNHGCSDLYGVNVNGLTNTWTHVAAVFSNNSYTQEQLYLNGVPQSLSALQGVPCNRNISTSARIANWQSNNGLYNFGGRIDELRIYNRALNAQEILNHYNDLK